MKHLIIIVLSSIIVALLICIFSLAREYNTLLDSNEFKYELIKAHESVLDSIDTDYFNDVIVETPEYQVLDSLYCTQL